MELENQNEQTSTNIEEENDEVFFFEEDSDDINNQPTELKKSYKELNKKFTQTSQEYSKIKKEVEGLREKASKIDELEKREQEVRRQEEINNFKNNYSWLSESSIKAISDLQKNNWEKTLEEIASEYGFLQEVGASVANSKIPKWRNFTLWNNKIEKIEISSRTMRKMWFKDSDEAKRIKSEFWL